MPNPITPDQRRTVLDMLAHGHDRDTIATTVGITPGQVSAIAAHVRMGTYQLPEVQPEATAVPPVSPSPVRETTPNLLARLRGHLRPAAGTSTGREVSSVWIGTDAETNERVYWNPDPATGTANPHVLVLGESGFGKTYTITCLLSELAQRGVVPIVFDYGQGFAADTLPPEFLSAVNLVEIQASKDGVDLNPLQIFPSDVLGPVNVAQRVADTFGRVYSRIGVQQHSILRQAVLDTMADQGIVVENPETWGNDLPAFKNVHAKLEEIARDGDSPHAKAAASVASHVSTLFVFNTFRPTGRKLTWEEVLAAKGSVFVLQLKGLEYSLERAVTEFLLWHLIGYIESLGPSPLCCFAVLDEAHKLSCERGSPVEKLLREGRKYGLGLILASQQPEDFSPVAFANTATKLVFQIGDEKSVVSRQLHRKIRNAHSFSDIYALITKLPRGCAYMVTDNVGRVTRIANIQERDWPTR